MKILLALFASALIGCTLFTGESSNEPKPENDSCIVLEYSPITDFYFGSHSFIHNGILSRYNSEISNYYLSADSNRYPTVVNVWELMDNVISIDHNGYWNVINTSVINDAMGIRLGPSNKKILRRLNVESQVVVEFDDVPTTIVSFDDSTVIGYSCIEANNESCEVISTLLRYSVNGHIDTINLMNLDPSIESISTLVTTGGRLYALGRKQGREFKSIWKYMNGEFVELCTNGASANGQILCNGIPYSLYDEMASGTIILKGAIDSTVLCDTTIGCEYTLNHITVLSFVDHNGIEIKRLRVPSNGHSATRIEGVDDRKGIVIGIDTKDDAIPYYFTSKSDLCSETSAYNPYNGDVKVEKYSIHDSRLEWTDLDTLLWDPVSLKF